MAETIEQMACKSVACYLAATQATWTGDYLGMLSSIVVPALAAYGQFDPVARANSPKRSRPEFQARRLPKSRTPATSPTPTIQPPSTRCCERFSRGSTRAMSRRRALTAVLASLLLGGAPAAPAPWSEAEIAVLRTRVDAALDSPALRGAHVGFIAVNATSGEPLYARNAGDEFAPASNFKLLTGSAAMRYLGPSFRFVTTVASDAPAQDGIVPGNVYLRGGGDAHLSAADLSAAARALAQAGIRRVTGALVVDASHDDAQRYAGGWSWEDLPYAYAAVVSALELEEGTVHAYVTPGASAGAPVTLRVEPQSAAFTVANEATTGAPKSDDTTDVVRSSGVCRRRSQSSEAFPAGAPESDDLAPSVPDPPAYAGDVFLRALQNAGIAVGGGVRNGVAPASRVTLWTHNSPPFPQLLAEFWLPSDNLMGELFVKELGAAREGEPGSYQNGCDVERAYLHAIGVDPATVSIADGSGLSVYDRITPRDIVAILESDWNDAQRAERSRRAA